MSASGVLPGEPPTSLMSPPLPAENTGSTPFCASLRTNSESGSSGAPKSEPSDRLTMSRWSVKSPSPSGSRAQSSACEVMLVEPAQPNTLIA